MFICTELIDLAWLGKVRDFENIHTIEGVMTSPILESVKNHINAYISHPTRDRNLKT